MQGTLYYDRRGQSLNSWGKYGHMIQTSYSLKFLLCLYIRHKIRIWQELMLSLFGPSFLNGRRWNLQNESKPSFMDMTLVVKFKMIHSILLPLVVWQLDIHAQFQSDPFTNSQVIIWTSGKCLFLAPYLAPNILNVQVLNPKVQSLRFEYCGTKS